MIAWSRSARARSGFGIAAIAASAALSSFSPRASAFRSWAYAFAAARSSAVHPLEVFPVAVVLLLDFCVAFFALIVPSSAGSPMSSFAQQDIVGRGPLRVHSGREHVTRVLVLAGPHTPFSPTDDSRSFHSLSGVLVDAFGTPAGSRRSTSGTGRSPLGE